MDVSTLTSIASQQAANAQNSAQTSGIKDKAANLSNASTEEELKGVLKDFESYFVEQLLKEVKKTFTETENKDEDNGMKQYKDMYMDKCIELVADDLVDEIGGNYTQQLYEQMRRNYQIDEVE